MAIVFYLTMRGIPQIFYGTEILMSHPGTESHGALRMDFPGGWDDDEENAFTGDGLSDRQREAQAFVQKLLNWRKKKPVIHGGELMQFTPIRNVYVYFRYDDDETIMVAFNRGEDAVTLDTTRFAERIGDARRAVDVIAGDTLDIGDSLTLRPRSVLLLEIER